MHPTVPEAVQAALPERWAAKLIKRLRGLYGAKFDQQWGSIAPDELVDIWADEISGYAGEEIARGLKACRSRPFPPTLPEFLLLCRPTMNPETAYHEAVAGMVARNRGERGEWSHPGIYWAAVRVTSHDLLSMGWQAIRGRWEAALRDVMSKGRWEPVPDPAPALPAPSKASLSREQQRQAMEQVRSAAASTSLERACGRDSLAWARAVIAHPKGRTPTVLAMARRALDMEVAP